MNRAIPVFFILLAVLSASAETNQERGKRIVDEAVEALGGRAFLAMEDRVESGRVYSFYRGKLSGLSLAKIYTRYLVRPEPPVAGFLGVRERQAFGKDGKNAVLFAEEKGYEITFRGAHPLPDATVERFKDTTLHNVFYILRQRLGEPGMYFDSRGVDVFDNQPVDIVDITDSENRKVTVLFNRTTKLPVRQIFDRRDPDSKDRIEEVTLFTKFRDVGGGVMWPFAIRRERNGEKIFEIFSDSVKVNQDLKDDLFTLPAGMKVLKKEK